MIKAYVWVIEILDIECVLGHVTGVQIENSNAPLSYTILLEDLHGKESEAKNMADFGLC
jgi:hypothetical protein